VSPVANSPGPRTMVYPAGAPGFAALHDGIDAAGNRDVEVEIRVAPGPNGTFRALLQQKEGDDLSVGALWTFTGGGLEQLLAEALVYPGDRCGVNDKKESVFSAVSPGTVLITLVQRVQARGALAGLTWDFSTTVDSNALVRLAGHPGRRGGHPRPGRPDRAGRQLEHRLPDTRAHPDPRRGHRQLVTRHHERRRDRGR
jgi:hypothetical protein